MEYVNILLQAEELVFDSAALRIIDAQRGEYVIPYDEIVLAYIAVGDVGKGDLGSCQTPEITDITKDMEGALLLCNRQKGRFTIQTDRIGDTAGELLEKLTRRAPHALFGFQPWLNEYDAGQFEEVLKMIDVMKECTV